VDYYNEFDNNAAAWLRELIDMGELPPGTVDDRSILDVVPDDLAGYRRCHFFAGIGGWEVASQIAEWNGPIWTASLPCQPFSAAGKQLGTADHRHLWPVFHRLVSECGPAILVGEQVASKAGREWFAAVRADLEALGYAVGAADLCASSIGSPHIRQRLYWCAIRMGNSGSERRQQIPGSAFEDEATHGGARRNRGEPDSDHFSASAGEGDAGYWTDPVYVPCADGKWRPLPRRLSNSDGTERETREPFPSRNDAAGIRHRRITHDRILGRVSDSDGGPTESCPQQSFDVLPPLLVRGRGEGVPEDQIDPDETAEGRVMRLKGYGNAIVPPLAAVFLETVAEIVEEQIAMS
jgi:DNA (cytosine-5)-methyltransferase 1